MTESRAVKLELWRGHEGAGPYVSFYSKIYDAISGKQLMDVISLEFKLTEGCVTGTIIRERRKDDGIPVFTLENGIETYTEDVVLWEIVERRA